MEAYHQLLRHVLAHGELREDRTGVGTYACFGGQARYDLTRGFPLVTTKTVHLKSIIYELLWFLKGDTNVHYLQEHGVKIWNEWAAADGSLGRVYGAQWRSWQSPCGKVVDQIAQLVQGLQKNPHGRRHIVCAWNPGELDQMALPPCHAFLQFFVSNKGGLSCQLYQRSADLFLGVPFNIASYALLTMMIAQVVGLYAETFVHTMGDYHIYTNHLEQVNLQLGRDHRPLPTMHLNPEVKRLEDFVYEDFEIRGYDPHPAIKAPVAV